MTKYLLIGSVIALRFLAASAGYDAMKLDLGTNIEDCATKQTKADFDNPVGSCECKTTFVPDKVCVMPIHKDRVTLNYGQNGLLGGDKVKSLKLTNKTKTACEKMVGQPAGFQSCNIMYAAYLCKGQEACDDGDCQVFCGFYPEITDGVTLQSLYPKMTGSSQGAWGFVEAGITCDASTPSRVQPPRTSPHDVCSWTTEGGDQERNSAKWGANADQCCLTVCSETTCGEGQMRKPDSSCKMRKNSKADCCKPCPGFPGTPCPGPARCMPPLPWTRWKTYSKCAQTPDYKENACADGGLCCNSNNCSSGAHCTTGVGKTAQCQVISGSPHCQLGAENANHDFLMVKDDDFPWNKKTTVNNSCYSVSECTELESGTKDRWIIFTRRNLTEYRPTLKQEGEKCSAFNTQDCSAGLICDNSKNVNTSSQGEGVCTSRSKSVAGNNCNTLPTLCETSRYTTMPRNCPAENLFQCSTNYACSSLLSDEGGVGTCQACDELMVYDGVKLHPKREDLRVKPMWLFTPGCSALATSANNAKVRCPSMHQWCPRIGKCFEYNIRSMNNCLPMDKDCPWADASGICWACPQGRASIWTSSGRRKATCGPQSAAFNGQDRMTTLDNGTNVTVSVRYGCAQCERKCESGYSYALTAGHEGKVPPGKRKCELEFKWKYGCPDGQAAAPLPESVQYDCPAGYERINATRSGERHEGEPKAYAKSLGHADGLVLVEYQQGCCKATAGLSTTAAPTTTAVGGGPKATTTAKAVVLGQKQVTTFKDLDFAKLTDAHKKAVVDSVCVATVAKNKGSKCTGVASKGSVIVTTEVTGVTGQLENFEVTDVLIAMKKVDGLKDALVAGKTWDTMDTPSIAASVPFTKADIKDKSSTTPKPNAGTGTDAGATNAAGRSEVSLLTSIPVLLLILAFVK